MRIGPLGDKCPIHRSGEAVQRESARRSGVKRVVYASSVHAVGFYPRSRTIDSDVTVLPDSRYGVSKAFGESLGALYAHKYCLQVMAVRIGNAYSGEGR